MVIASLLHYRKFRYLGAFYLHAIITNFALSIFNIFNGIYIYLIIKGTGQSPELTLALSSFLLAFQCLIPCLLTPFAIWLISYKGLKANIFLGSISLILYFIFLYLSRFDPYALLIAAFLGGANIAIYFTAYQSYFAELTDDQRQGKEISIQLFLSSLVSIGGPSFGALLIHYGGFNFIFFITGILLLTSIWPLFYLPKHDSTVPVNISKIKSMFNIKKEGKNLLSLFAIGITHISAFYFWPLYAFSIVDGFDGIGLLGSLTALVTALMNLPVGFLIDKFGPKKILYLFVPLEAINWALKTLVSLPWHVFTISASKAISTPAVLGSSDSLIYERARHHDLLATVVQREIGFSFGRFIFLIVLGILFYLGIPLLIVFPLTSLLTLLIMLYQKNQKI